MAASDGGTHEGERDERDAYQVAVNDEEQYSVWPSNRDLPAGWRAAGMMGPRDACLAWIDEHWTDMRPRSLRQAMEARP